jgi:hypothetical protein
MDRPHRLKRLMIGDATLLDWFAQALSPPPGRAWVIDAPALPAGCRVLSVTHDWSSCQFGFLLEHPDFPEVPEGATIPPLHEFGAMSMRLVEPGVPDPEPDATVAAGPPPGRRP